MPNDDTTSTEDPRHDHTAMPMPAETGDQFGCPEMAIDVEALSALVGAAIDSCRPCQDAQLDAIAGDPLTVARLVEVSAVAVHGAFGGLPDNMVTEDDAASSLGADYRAMLRAGVDRGTDHVAMYTAACALDDAGRRAVADDALDMLIGVLFSG